MSKFRTILYHVGLSNKLYIFKDIGCKIQDTNHYKFKQLFTDQSKIYTNIFRYVCVYVLEENLKLKPTWGVGKFLQQKCAFYLSPEMQK